jgi:hypothetical protein
LVQVLKAKNFDKIRRWVAENFEYGSFPEIMTELWESIDKYLEPREIPQYIMISTDYQDRYSRCISHEIHFIAYLLDLSSQLTFK